MCIAATLSTIFDVIPETDSRILICTNNYTTVQERIALFTASFREEATSITFLHYALLK